jgi:hypothetical protein
VKVIVVAVVAVLMMVACGDDDSSDDSADAERRMCLQYEALGPEPSDSDLDELVTTAEESDDPELIDEVEAAVAEIKAGDDGGPAAEALAGTCG